MSDNSDTTEQDAIQHHQEVLTTLRERLAILLAQQAHFGSYVPPHIISEIRATQQALHPLKAWLRSQSVIITDQPNDDIQIAVDSSPGTTPNQIINNQAPNQGAQGIFNAPVTFSNIRRDDEQSKR